MTTITTASKQTNERILWMADCYNLAKRFPNSRDWANLLKPVKHENAEDLNPFHYWLWMEIWKVAQSDAN